MSSVILLDNRDSFTYNLVEDFRLLGLEVRVFRNTVKPSVVTDALSDAKGEDGGPVLVVSPGPGTPSTSGCLMEVLSQTVGAYPILGICLGHQALIEHCGGTLRRSNPPRHGKVSPLTTTGSALFEGVAQTPFVGRYHSLVADSVPEELKILAECDGEVMAVHHRHHPAIGVQFHPESLLTPEGRLILANALAMLREGAAA